MCYDSNAQPPLPPTSITTAHGADLVLTARDGNRFAAYLATPEHATGACVLILPDVRGLHQFYKDLAMRFGEVGITALALDYFGRSAGLSPRDDTFEYMPHVQQLRIDSFQLDVQTALAHLRADGDHPIFTMGFCMGGSLSLLTGTHSALKLSGVISFYAGLARAFGGGGTVLEEAMRITYPTLALFAGDDAGIPAEQVETFDQELDRTGVEHTVITYPGTTHSFFDRRASEFAAASADAWSQILAFINAHTAVAV